MPVQQIPLIVEIIDKIVSPDDRRRKYSDRQIIMILVLLQIFRILYRSTKLFLKGHEEYHSMIGLSEMSNFRTLPRRARKLDIHAINREIMKIVAC